MAHYQEERAMLNGEMKKRCCKPVKDSQIPPTSKPHNEIERTTIASQHLLQGAHSEGVCHHDHLIPIGTKCPVCGQYVFEDQYPRCDS